MKLKIFSIGIVLLYIAAQVVLGLILHFIFQWGLVDIIVSSIVNGVIFLTIWAASLKIILEHNKELKE